MTLAAAERRVSVGRVRIRGRGDPLRLRLGVDRLLGSADIRPGRLPPAAILVVRSLADPLPRRLDTRSGLPSHVWQRAVAGALDEWVHRALRPAGGGGEAGAVLFADRSELLSCLSRDWCEGALSTRWWWRALRVHAPPDVLRAFAETPEAVPAALERLAEISLATAFAARVPPGHAALLARAVAAVHGVEPAAEAALAGPAPKPDPILPPPTALALFPPRIVPRSPGEARTTATEADGAVLPPWHALVRRGTGLEALAPEQEALVGLSLALRASPLRVRTDAFVSAVRAWRAGREPVASPPPGSGPTIESAAAAVAEAPPATGAEESNPAVAFPHAPEPRTRSDGRPRPQPDAASEPEPRQAMDPPPDPLPELAPKPAEPLATLVETRLAGLFHLVLVAQLLGLYGDFAEPGRPGIALDPWDFVTMLGRRLLGRPPRDPAWALLAGLAGRAPSEPPGLGFRPPRTWRVPPGWLEPFGGGGTWRAGESRGSVLLVHPAGFPVVDAPRGELARELRRYGVSKVAPVPPRIEASKRDRWVENLTAYVRARLAVALDLPPRDAVRLALRRPGRVLVTATRIDVVAALVDLPIEVRLAGLDRDPGYVPAAGRSLYFHFE